MFEEKDESFWKKKGFYLSACVAILCVLAIGTVYYKVNYQNDNGKNLFADSATATPDYATNNAAGSSAISESANNNTTTDTDNSSENSVSVAQNNIQENTSTAQPNNTPDNNTNKEDTDNNNVKNNTSDNSIVKKETVLADSSKVNKVKDNTKNKDNNKSNKNQTNDSIDKSDKSSSANSEKNIESKDNVVATMTDTETKNKFDMEKGLLWPVTGDVILKYSMNNTVYFKTLAQYKCNPAIIIASKEGTNVKSAADGTISKITKSDETGNLITMDIGSGYSVIYGQLDDISVKEGQFVKEGSTIGKIAKPTKYYSEEGSNLYLQVTEDDKPVDPMLLLR